MNEQSLRELLASLGKDFQEEKQSPQQDYLTRESRYTPLGLVDRVVLAGSMQADSNWSESDGLSSSIASDTHEILKSKSRTPEDIKNRLTELEKSSVVVFRLENNGRSNENIDTVGEIGLSVVNALINGRQVIVSIDDKMREGYSDAYSKAQFEAFLVLLGQFADKFSDYCTIHHGNDMDELGKLAHHQAQRQRLMSEATRPYYSGLSAPKLPALQAAGKPWVVVTGTGNTDINGDRSQMFLERATVVNHIKNKTPDSKISVLTEGTQALAWDEAYKHNSSEMFRNLSLTEADRKLDADALFVIVNDEATTISGTNEIPWFVANLLIASRAGVAKDVFIMIEDFSALDHFKKKVKETFDKYNNSGEMGLTELCRTLGIDQAALEADPTAIKVLLRIVQNQPVQWGEIGSTALVDSELFQRDENAQKVRTMMSAWLDKVKTTLPPEVASRLHVAKNAAQMGSLVSKAFAQPVANPMAPHQPPVAPVRPPYPTTTVAELKGIYDKLAEQAPLIQGRNGEIGSKLEQALGLPTGSIKTTVYDGDDGPNVRPQPYSALNIFLVAPNNRELSLLTVRADVYAPNPNQAFFTVDTAQLQAAVNRLKPQNTPSYSSSSTGTVPWWR